MGTYWVTDALPMGVVSLIPFFLVPMMGLLPMDQVALNYMKASTVSFIGNIICALAIEKSGLHRRIALRILLGLGPRFHWLMLGCMIPTFLLSMFIVNTASTATMLPMIEAILEQLDPDIVQQEEEPGQVWRDDNNGLTEASPGEVVSVFNQLSSGADPKINDQASDYGFAPSDIILKSFKQNTNDGRCNQAFESDAEITMGEAHHCREEDEDISECKTHNKNGKYEASVFISRSKGLTLACVHAANIGGISTLTGTTPNLIMQQYADDYFESKGVLSPVNYATWMIYGLPTAIIALVLTWFWLMILYGTNGQCCCSPNACRRRSPDDEESEEKIRQIVRKEYNQLGRMSFHEGMVLFLFISLFLLWFFREPGFMTGWADAFNDGYI